MTDLPARLDTDAGVDEELGELAITWVSHGQQYKTYVLFCKVRPVPKLSDAEKEVRRRRVLDGARRCFARYGYDGATVVRLEREIGLSRGAIFNWFPSKQELFLALAAEDNDPESKILTVIFWL